MDISRCTEKWAQVRTLCKPVKFLHTKLIQPCLYGACFVHWCAVMLEQEGVNPKLFPQSWEHEIVHNVLERPLSSSIMLSKKDPGSSSSSSSSSGGNGADRALETSAGSQSGAVTGSAASSADVKKKERASPGGEASGVPLPHLPGSAGADQDSAEGRRTSRRKRAKVNT
ncbi:hypothetical protein QTP70_007710 [Hemibagrus guttatus]|uniref:Uncharacterized protein n=1 Tax=Hemibagrus guttatus TaxID=175788 RepID=A0AAE0QZV5_9TELE|nr:hypothetical protein QTP70_007710 [Hemibagrus guttatus]